MEEERAQVNRIAWPTYSANREEGEGEQRDA